MPSKRTGAGETPDDGSTDHGATDANTDTRPDREGGEGGGDFPRAVVAADLRRLVEYIEEVHADPFQGYDSRVALHRDLESAVRALPATVSEERAYRAAAGLVAGLDDAHSRVVPPTDDTDDGRLPVSLRVVGDAVYVDGVYEESLGDVLGARLLAVEGESLDRLADRYAALRGAETPFFVHSAVAKNLAQGDRLDRLLGDMAPAAPTLELRLPDGTETERSVTRVAGDATPSRAAERSVTPSDGTGPRYRLYDDRAVLVPGNLTHYREVVQAARERGAQYTESIAQEAYRSHHDEASPEELDAIVPRLPSMTETLRALVREMDDAGTEGLVVDLRDNPGGDSRFVQFIAYFLFGWEPLVEASDWPVALKRRTSAHREEYGVPDHARDEYATFEENPAGYDFGTRFRTQEMDRAERINDHRETLAPGAFGEELDDERHEAYYTPDRVVVATTARTMSSAFAGAALLSELGADVVGVPPGQAPLSFGEAVQVELPNTGLSVELAGSMYRWTPNPTEDVLPMARELTPSLFEGRYDRAGDAVLQLALDHLAED